MFRLSHYPDNQFLQFSKLETIGSEDSGPDMQKEHIISKRKFNDNS